MTAKDLMDGMDLMNSMDLLDGMGALPPLVVSRKDGTECFTREGRPVDICGGEGARRLTVRLSAITFGIGEKLSWDAASHVYSTEACRASNVYVFCVLSHTDKSTVDPLNLDQWEFYVLPTRRLNELCAKQKTIALKRVMELGAVRVRFEGIAEAVREAVG